MIEGVRQCGKTTLARQLKGDIDYRTLDDIAMREAVESDLKAFLQTDAEMMVIDEVQRSPELIPEIKRIVDLNTRPGQFLLTGSAHIPSLPHVKESLAGRIQRVRLRPFSQGELRGSSPDFFERILKGKPATPKNTLSKKQLLEHALIGGYPEIQTFDHRQRQKWHRDYVSAILSRDLQDVAQVRKPDQMQSLIAVVAAWSSKLMDISAIGRSLSIQRPTLESYLSALKTLFLIEEVPAWTNTDYSRVAKRSKLFMSDPGLMASLLRYPSDPGNLDDDQTGKLMEVLVFCELMALADASDDRFIVHHYRDNEQREIDFLVEDQDGGYVGVEVKSGLTVKSDAFKHMRWFDQNLAKGRAFTGIVLYSGNEVVAFGPNLWAVPTSLLWLA